MPVHTPDQGKPRRDSCLQAGLWHNISDKIIVWISNMSTARGFWVRVFQIRTMTKTVLDTSAIHYNPDSL